MQSIIVFLVKSRFFCHFKWVRYQKSSIIQILLVIFLRKHCDISKKVYQNISSENEFLVKQSRISYKIKEKYQSHIFYAAVLVSETLADIQTCTLASRTLIATPLPKARTHAASPAARSRLPLHLHKCTRSHSALPFTPPLNAALASQG